VAVGAAQAPRPAAAAGAGGGGVGSSRAHAQGAHTHAHTCAHMHTLIQMHARIRTHTHGCSHTTTNESMKARAQQTCFRAHPRTRMCTCTRCASPRRLLRLLALSLGLDEGSFAHPMLFLRPLHYEGRVSVPSQGVFAAGEPRARPACAAVLRCAGLRPRIRAALLSPCVDAGLPSPHGSRILPGPRACWRPVKDGWMLAGCWMGGV